MKMKEKALSFMQKHPKLLGATITTAGSVAMAVPLSGGIVASAEDIDPVATVTSTLVTRASGAFNSGTYGVDISA